MRRTLRYWLMVVVCCSPGAGATCFAALAIANNGSAGGISIDWLLRNCSLLAIPMLTSIVGLILLSRRQD